MGTFKMINLLIIFMYAVNVTNQGIWKIKNCTENVYRKNSYREKWHDLVIGIYLKNGPLDTVSLILLQKSLNQLEKTNIRGFNLNILFYYFTEACVNNVHSTYLDILINNSVNYGRPFKLIGLISYLNDQDLTQLANIMSHYSIPIIAFLNSGSSNIQHEQTIHEHYDNVLLMPYSDDNKINFLVDFVKTFNVNLVTILDTSEGKYEEKAVFIKSSLSMHSICVNSFSVKGTVVKQYDYYKLLVEKTFSNTFLILNEDNNVLRHTLHFLSYKNDTNRIIIYNKFHHNLRSLLDLYSDSYLRSIGIFGGINPKTDIITMYAEDPIRFSIQRFEDWVVIFRQVIKKFRNSLKMQYSNNDYRNLHISFIKQSLLPYIKGSHHPDVYVMIYVGHMRRIRTTFEYKLIYLSGIWVFDKKNLTSLFRTPVCSKNCSSGTYPSYISSKCCGICVRCNPGYVKPAIGQYQCSKCGKGTVANYNQTKCLSFQYQFYTINLTHKMLALILPIFGVSYTLFILCVFLCYRKTPVVKSSNFPLSVIQLLLHMVLNIHLIITYFGQSYSICMVHVVAGGYILKLILSIYIIKTNQLLTIFQSKVRVERTYFVKAKELFYPFVYIITNIFVNIVLLTQFRFEYGIYEVRFSLTRYQYCSMNIYMNADILLLTILSLICSFQSFLARKLPANFNETYYIFLGMFTSALLFGVSFPLDATFNKDGRKIFVNSCMIYSINMALVSITYGYKIVIILFQKHKNTKEVFQKIMLECIQDDVRKRTNKPNTKNGP